MKLLDNYKLEIFTELSENFPEKAENIINLAEEYCTKEKSFLSLSDEEKAQVVINKIFDDNNIFNEDLSIFLEINKYISIYDPQTILDNIQNEYKKIERLPFFNKKSVLNESSKEDIENVQEIDDLINQIKNDCTLELISLNVEIKNQITLIKKSNKITKNKDNDKIKQTLSKLHLDTLEINNKISDIYKDLLAKSLEISKNITKNNKDKEIKEFIEKVNSFKNEIEKIISKQENILGKINDFQLLPVENIIVFPEFIEDFSNFISLYPIIKNNLLSIEKQIYIYDETKSLITSIIDIENIFTENFKLFVQKSVKAFEKGIPDAKDKNRTFKNKFIEPVKSKFSEESLKAINNFVDMVF